MLSIEQTETFRHRPSLHGKTVLTAAGLRASFKHAESVGLREIVVTSKLLLTSTTRLSAMEVARGAWNCEAD